MRRAPLASALARATSTAMGSESVAMTCAARMARAAAMASTPEPQPRSSTRRVVPCTRQLVDGQQAAERGAVVGCAEGLPGVDQDGARAVGDAPAVVAAVHDEAAGDDRRQGGLRHGHPIEIGEVLEDDIGDRPADTARQRRRGGLGLGAVLRIGFHPPGAGAVLEQGHGIKSRARPLRGRSRSPAPRRDRSCARKAWCSPLSIVARRGGAAAPHAGHRGIAFELHSLGADGLGQFVEEGIPFLVDVQRRPLSAASPRGGRRGARRRARRR